MFSSVPNFLKIKGDIFNQCIHILFAVIMASCIIILITTNMTDPNALSALIGGYSGLLLGMLFIIVLNFNVGMYSVMDMFPLLMVMIISIILISYLSIYFDKISKGDVSGYYSSFSLLSTVFLFTQLSMIFSAIFKNTNNNNNNNNNHLFSYSTLSFLGLFSLINVIIVVTLGIVLKFYSTQG